MKRLLITSIALIGLLSCVAANEDIIDTHVKSDQANFRLVRIVEGISHPWAFAFLPEGDVLITERAGRLWRLEGTGTISEIGGLPEVNPAGQGGLLDIVLHPDYKANGWIYMTHVIATPAGRVTALSRARLVDSRLTDLERLLTADNAGRTTRHFGSRLAFDGRGFLYMTLGERGESERAQDPSDHAGSTLRLKDDGTVPSDNPFVGDPSRADEIYSFGHRNAQGLVYDPYTDKIWLNEHGARGGDEVNIEKRGANFGWPVISYGRHYSGAKIGVGTSASGMEQPQIYWDPSIAPSGMEVYTGSAFPAWQGDFFVGALAGQHLRRLERKDGRIVAQEVLLEGRIGRIRDVGQGPDGFLYLLTDEQNGGFYRLEPSD